MSQHDPAAAKIDVSYVAHLARLQLTPEETGRFQLQLEGILSYVNELREVDVTGVEPTAHAVPVRNVMREDAVLPSLDHAAALDNAPRSKSGQFFVPKIID